MPVSRRARRGRAEVVVDDHDARLDQHLAHRDVERTDQAADVASLSAVSCSSSVLVRSSTATLPREDSSELALRLDQRGEVIRLGVVDLQVLGAQRRELLESLRAARSAFSRAASSSAGATMMTLSVLALVEALGAQHDVERLVPGHVLQAQRDAARDRVADDDVLAARVGEQLQHGAGLDVLEVQRQRSPVYCFRRLGRFLRRGCTSTTYWSSLW
jgi:hypothetical protein